VSIKTIELPPKLIPLFAKPRGELQFRGSHGGRGSAKSRTFAKMAAIWGAVESLRILCTRELQNSIKESFHAELKAAIASDDWLSSVYDVGVDYIRHRSNGTEFLFRGLRHAMGAIKSTARVDLTIVEEAEDVPDSAWVDLLPTVLREDKSEVWVIWNPKKKGSAVDKRFRLDSPSNTMIVEMNYKDNPWFPRGLDQQRLDNKRTMDDATYRHIWEGAYLERSEAQVFKGKYVEEEFTPRHDWAGPYFGVDWGFANDPTAGVKCWINNRNLYIEYDCAKVGLELDDTAQYLIAKLPDISSYKSQADCARPESISYVKRHGIPMMDGVSKGKGSVEDGVEFIKSFDCVVIHPRCQETLSEFRLYSYKTDRYTNEVLPALLDENNHLIDSLRYALEPVMKNNTFSDYGSIL
jgi:phage terminase large subunit